MKCLNYFADRNRKTFHSLKTKFIQCFYFSSKAFKTFFGGPLKKFQKYQKSLKIHQNS